MGKYLKLKALFLLCVVSLITLQNAVPHIHHSHDELEEIVLTSSEKHDHHDHNHLENKNTSVLESTFLHQLVEDHSHSSHSHELTQLNSTDTRSFNVSVLYIGDLTTIVSWSEKIDTELRTFNNSGKVLSPHISGFTLRGPPTFHFS